MNVLSDIQSLLAAIYDVSEVPDVRDFVFSDSEVLEYATQGESRVSQTENLIIAEQDSELFMSLFLNPDLLERLKKKNPIVSLHAGNVGDFWVALEGISHFIYAAEKAGKNRNFSLHELELQAEIDKFVVSRYLLRKQGNQRFANRVHNVLFEQTHLATDLEELDRYRYQSANAYAARYCWDLFLSQRQPLKQGELARELRYFYDLPHQSKIKRIDGAMYATNFRPQATSVF